MVSYLSASNNFSRWRNFSHTRCVERAKYQREMVVNLMPPSLVLAQILRKVAVYKKSIILLKKYYLETRLTLPLLSIAIVLMFLLPRQCEARQSWLETKYRRSGNKNGSKRVVCKSFFTTCLQLICESFANGVSRSKA
jgi:hypothetical protein